MNLENWLERRTFHHSKFADLSHLLEKKTQKGLSVSVCIPTLNEGDTIGKTLEILKEELMEKTPLIDELIVIDSGSTDKTQAIVESHQVKFKLANDILPQLETKRGKGENLWKAIYELKGDIICYIDADISNIDPHFVYGLVAPLIEDDDIHYVKAFYERPMQSTLGINPAGGGRVTEILVRPLFSMFFPELSGFIQPLSGEYAARRMVLEQLSFPIGYGVETSHLIEIYQKWGLKHFAQTDLDVRFHCNQTTRALGKMSFGILQSFFKYLNPDEIPCKTSELSSLYRYFETQDLKQTEVQIKEEFRPPMMSISKYADSVNYARYRRPICRQ